MKNTTQQFTAFAKYRNLLFLEDGNPVFIKRAEKFILHETSETNISNNFSFEFTI